MRQLVGWVVLSAITAAGALASAADHVSVTLAYVRKDAAATACPDEATFRALVGARLGYDPFVANGALALTVELQPRGGEIVGRLGLTGKGSESRGERTLRSGGDDCLELVTSMALAAAVAVDPDAVRAQDKPPASPPPAAPPLDPPPRDAVSLGRPASRSARPERPGLALRLDAGGVLPVGVVPAVRGGLRVGAAIDAGVGSIGVEGAFFFPSAREGQVGEVTAYVVHGSLVPCIRPVPSDRLLLDLCVVGSLGAMRSSSEGVTRSRPLTDLFATVGPRLSFTAMATSAFGLAASLDVPVPLSRVHLLIEDRGQGQEVWASSPVGLVGGLSLVLRLQ